MFGNLKNQEWCQEGIKYRITALKSVAGFFGNEFQAKFGIHKGVDVL